MGNKILIPLIKDFSVVDLIINEKVYGTKQINKNKTISNNKKIKNAPGFLWPAKGKVIKSFGKFGDGQHYDGITAYSNLGKYNVEVGDKLKKQQIIAYTPDDKNYFHFQLRHNRNPVNPLIYLN